MVKNHSFKMTTTKHFSEQTSEWLYKINVWLGFLPPKMTLPRRFSRIRTYAMVVLTSILFWYCLTEGGETDGYENLRPQFATHVVLTHLSFVFMYISILVTFIHVRIIKGAAILSLLDELDKIGDKFERRFIPGWKFTLEVYISLFLALAYVIYEEIQRNMFHVYASFRKIFIVASVILGLQIHSFGIQFHQRFKHVNRLLMKMILGKAIHVYPRRDVYDIFLALVNSVLEFNRIFGWQILFLCGTFVLCVLHVINSVIVILNVSDLNEISGHFWGVFLLYLLTTLVICIPFASSCNDAAEEAKTTSLLAYTLLAQKQKIINGYVQDRFEDFKLLAAVAWPGFSAAGFFEVDHTMLFTLFGSVTSYLIVLIQLKDMQL